MANWHRMSAADRAMGLTFTLFGLGQFGIGAAARRMPSSIPPDRRATGSGRSIFRFPDGLTARSEELAYSLWDAAGRAGRSGSDLLLDPVAHLTHHDTLANNAYVIDLRNGHTAFSGTGDNRAGRTSHTRLSDHSLPGWQQNAPNTRAGLTVRGHIKPLDTVSGPTDPISPT